MRKPLISLSLLVFSLQACSGKPAGFQGDTATVSGTGESGDATGRNFGNRDSGSDDATAAVPVESDNGEIIETDGIEMDDSVIYEGTDATVAVPADAAGTQGSGASSSTPSAPATTTTTAPQPLTLVITVPSTSLRAGSAPMQATAKLSGQTSPANVTWSVRSSGTASAGTISETGLYTAPATGGGYDIIISAALVDDPSITASVTIKLIANEQIFVGCQQGSEFFPITADVYQLPVNTTKLPDFSTLGTRLTKVCMDQYNVAPRDWSTGFPGVTNLFEWFALHTTTNIVVPMDGSYSFKLNSDDGAKLYIDGKLVIDNDGQHAPTAKEATVTLTAGQHALSIDYFQGPRYQIALELYWKTPGASSYVYVPKASFK